MGHLQSCLWLLAFTALWYSGHGMSGGSHGSGGISGKREDNVKCVKKARYRRPDGQCNNLDHPEWGSANSNLMRFVDPAYGDGISTPRTKDGNGKDLPSPRLVSLNCHTASDSRSDVTLMVMQWGQFLDHDITLTAGSTEVSGSHVRCDCSSTDDVCFKIPLDNDPHFASRDCLEFTRSAGELVKDRFGNTHRQQINVITSFIDGSNIYGSSESQLEDLRFSRDSRLRFRRVRGQGKMLPEGDDPDCTPAKDEFCFLAGDARVNEQPGLSAMHTIFMRQHNTIARHLRFNTHWNDEKVFQESRKIMEALIQKITYTDFIPLLVGVLKYIEHSLGPDEYRYTKRTQPDIGNSFATAAYRFGHSLIPEGIDIKRNTLLFKDMFFSPTQTLTALSSVVRALTKEKSMGVDNNFAESITNHLFQVNSEHDGTDLVSLNIQRGRDHGLPAYNKFRELCGLDKLTSLYELFGHNTRASGTFASIDDVDLFTGGMWEYPPAEGGLLGPTFQCILAKQFQALKEGDRFFYLNTDKRTGFTAEQIDEINKITLSKVICDNTENRKLQENIFLPYDRRSEFDSIDLRKWTDGNSSSQDSSESDGSSESDDSSDSSESDDSSESNESK